MADSKGNFVTKKIGPLPAWGYVALAVAAYVGVRLYRDYESNVAANEADATEEGVGTAAPAASTSSSTGTGTSITDMSSWETAAIASMTTGADAISAADAFNAIQDWTGGTCVDQAAYNALSAAITSIGIPPGISTGFPTITVCAATTTTTPPPTSTIKTIGTELLKGGKQIVEGSGTGVGAGYSGETLQGSGYAAKGAQYAGVVKSLDGKFYQVLSSNDEAEAARAAGEATYYQPTPGTFIKVTAAVAKVLTAGTPQFVLTTKPAGTTKSLTQPAAA